MYRTDQPWNRKGLLKAVTILLVLSAATAGYAADEEEDLKWWNPPEMTLTAIVPWGNQTALQFNGGWALTLQITASERRLLGIGVTDYPPTLPGLGTQGWLVFDDPDGCPSFIEGLEGVIYKSVICDGIPSTDYPQCDPSEWGLSLPYACPDQAPPGYDWWADVAALGPWPNDETWVEFRPGVSQPASVPQAEQESRPEVWINKITEWGTLEVGPYLGSEDDETRYGRWGRLPGLVVLADHGPGLLTRPLDPTEPYPINSPSTPTLSHFFDPPDQLEAWNLAGFFNAIGYTLLANSSAPVGWGRTTMTVQMVAPAELFTPVVLKDSNITNRFQDDYQVWCEAGNSAYRLDGGPLTCYPGSLDSVDQVINNTLITLRIFVVNGDPPDKFQDMDGDGVIDIDDVEAMGFEALTRQETVTFHQHHQLNCAYPYDFDGDGQPGGCVLGARAGGITGVPR